MFLYLEKVISMFCRMKWSRLLSLGRLIQSSRPDNATHVMFFDCYKFTVVRNEHQYTSKVHFVCDNLVNVQEKLLHLLSSSDQNTCRTRMHSSRMLTVHCNGRFSCHACPLPCIPFLPCMPLCHVRPSPEDRILDTRLWKHYFATASLRAVKSSKSFHVCYFTHCKPNSV